MLFSGVLGGDGDFLGRLGFLSSPVFCSCSSSSSLPRRLRLLFVDL